MKLVPGGGGGGLFPRIKYGGVKLATRLHFVPKLRMSGAITCVPHTPSFLLRDSLYIDRPYKMTEVTYV
jgi:hypothetical protein